MSHVVIQAILASTVANAGTFTASYPDREGPETGKFCEGDFHLGVNHKLVMAGNELSAPKDFTVAMDATNITITNATGADWLTGSEYFLQLERAGKAVYRDNVTGARVNRMGRSDTFIINLGSPDTADADGICASQSVTASVASLLNGAVGAVLDVPRNVVGAWTNTAVCTVVGTDEYGVAMSEASASGTTLTGKKAFKTITSVTFSANVTGATVGTGDVLGLPVFLPHIGCVLAELQDAAKATSVTPVVGLSTGKSTTTTADVRGTYDPNAACNGEINFSLIVSLPDPGYLGVAQA